MAVTSETTVVVTPAYRQFYLRRGVAAWRSAEVSDEGYEAGLEAIDGFAYVGTTMYGSPTRVTVRIHLSDPGGPDAADRVADALFGGEGDVAVLDWEPDEPPVAELAVPAGALRLRVSWHGMAEALAHPDYDLGGDDMSPERIVVELWPAT